MILDCNLSHFKATNSATGDSAQEKGMGRAGVMASFCIQLRAVPCTFEASCMACFSARSDLIVQAERTGPPLQSPQ